MAKEQTGTPNSKSRSVRGTLVVVLIIVLLIVNGVYFVVAEQKKKEQLEFTENLAEELQEKANELERLQVDLDAKIEEIKKLGGDVSELEFLKNQLEIQVRQANRRDVKSREELQALTETIQNYETMLLQKDETIAQLRSTNEALLTENTDLKQTTNRLQDTLSAMAQSRQEMQAQIDVAARLRAENVRIIAVNRRGRERSEGIKNRHLETLRVTFNIADNSVAPKEAVDVFMRIVEPGGNVLFDIATTSGEFTVEGRGLLYTAKHTILFDNSLQRLNFEYTKGSDYVKGEHMVELYADDYYIGSGTFVVE